jgi:hypothetical protein
MINISWKWGFDMDQYVWKWGSSLQLFVEIFRIEFH